MEDLHFNLLLIFVIGSFASSIFFGAYGELIFSAGANSHVLNGHEEYEGTIISSRLSTKYKSGRYVRSGNKKKWVPGKEQHIVMIRYQYDGIKNSTIVDGIAHDIWTNSHWCDSKSAPFNYERDATIYRTTYGEVGKKALIYMKPPQKLCIEGFRAQANLDLGFGLLVTAAICFGLGVIIMLFSIPFLCDCHGLFTSSVSACQVSYDNRIPLFILA